MPTCAASDRRAAVRPPRSSGCPWRAMHTLSSRSYYDYVREHVFKPASMMSTDSPPEDSALEGGSTGYVRAEGGGFRPNTATLPPRGSPAGGGYSTVQDLL